MENRKFNAKWYLEKNPDVAASGMDPLEHYIQHGASEGRRPVPPSVWERFSIRCKVVFSVLNSVRFREGGLAPVIKLVVRTLLREGFSGAKLKILRHHHMLVSKAQSNISYLDWIARANEKYESERNDAITLTSQTETPPLISIVMATYNTPENFLVAAINSVLNQSYTNWELCIADDCSSSPFMKGMLLNFRDRDQRIKICFRDKNGHISEATNSAIGMTTGSYVGFFDHDDELSPDALLYVAAEIIKNPSAKLIFTDEDKIDEMGNRSDPYFKCDFNYELMLTQNMICHFAVFEKSLLEQIGYLRTELNGAQDYDLCLRAIECVQLKNIIHIPKVLYHWRMHAASTSSNTEAKPYAVLAGRSAVEQHLIRSGTPAKVLAHPSRSFWNRIEFKVPAPQPSVDIIIPTRDRIALLQVCVDSILNKTTYENYVITIVDNGSIEAATLAQFDIWKKNPKINIFRDDSPFNYSSLNNKAVRKSASEFICLLNNDIEIISPGWLNEMVSHASRPNVGCVGARLWYPDNTLQHGGVIVGLGGVAGHSHKHFGSEDVGYFGRAVSLQALSCVTAAALMIKKSIYEEVDGLDESLQVAFNDVDFCLRVREAGYRNVWTPFAEMYHYESATRGHEDNPQKVKRFNSEIEFMKARWGEKLLFDPYYSPNLTLDREDFSIASYPR